jgi:hypothetical protein
MRIGRDHIASTIYTIVFAYAGAALPVLLLLFLYERPVLDMLQTESLSEEIVRTLASAIGLVLAVPVTTLIAALTVGAAKAPAADVPAGPYDDSGGRGRVPVAPSPNRLHAGTSGAPARPAGARPAGARPAGTLPTAADLQRAAEGPPPPRTRAEARSRMTS